MNVSDLNKHDIFFQTSIVRTPGWCTNTASAGSTVGDADVIDLDQSGRGEYHTAPGKMFHDTCVYTEPVLVDDLTRLRSLARRTGGQFVTRRDYPFAQVATRVVSVASSMLGEDEVFDSAPQTISRLVDRRYPGETGVPWAIDAREREFYIFK